MGRKQKLAPRHLGMLNRKDGEGRSNIIAPHTLTPLKRSELLGKTDAELNKLFREHITTSSVDRDRIMFDFDQDFVAEKTVRLFIEEDLGPAPSTISTLVFDRKGAFYFRPDGRRMGDEDLQKSEIGIAVKAVAGPGVNICDASPKDSILDEEKGLDAGVASYLAGNFLVRRGYDNTEKNPVLHQTASNIYGRNEVKSVRERAEAAAGLPPGTYSDSTLSQIHLDPNARYRRVEGINGVEHTVAAIDREQGEFTVRFEFPNEALKNEFVGPAIPGVYMPGNEHDTPTSVTFTVLSRAGMQGLQNRINQFNGRLPRPTPRGPQVGTPMTMVLLSPDGSKEGRVVRGLKPKEEQQGFLADDMKKVDEIFIEDENDGETVVLPLGTGERPSEAGSTESADHSGNEIPVVFIDSSDGQQLHPQGENLKEFYSGSDPDPDDDDSDDDSDDFKKNDKKKDPDGGGPGGGGPEGGPGGGGSGRQPNRGRRAANRPLPLAYAADLAFDNVDQGPINGWNGESVNFHHYLNDPDNGRNIDGIEEAAQIKEVYRALTRFKLKEGSTFEELCEPSENRELFEAAFKQGGAHIIAKNRQLERRGELINKEIKLIRKQEEAAKTELGLVERELGQGQGQGQGRNIQALRGSKTRLELNLRILAGRIRTRNGELTGTKTELEKRKRRIEQFKKDCFKAFNMDPWYSQEYGFLADPENALSEFDLENLGNEDSVETIDGDIDEWENQRRLFSPKNLFKSLLGSDHTKLVISTKNYPNSIEGRIYIDPSMAKPEVVESKVRLLAWKLASQSCAGGKIEVGIEGETQDKRIPPRYMEYLILSLCSYGKKPSEIMVRGQGGSQSADKYLSSQFPATYSSDPTKLENEIFGKITEDKYLEDRRPERRQLYNKEQNKFEAPSFLRSHHSATLEGSRLHAIDAINWHGDPTDAARNFLVKMDVGRSSNNRVYNEARRQAIQKESENYSKFIPLQGSARTAMLAEIGRVLREEYFSDRPVPGIRVVVEEDAYNDLDKEVDSLLSTEKRVEDAELNDIGQYDPLLPEQNDLKPKERWGRAEDQFNRTRGEVDSFMAKLPPKFREGPKPEDYEVLLEEKGELLATGLEKAKEVEKFKSQRGAKGRLVRAATEFFVCTGESVTEGIVAKYERLSQEHRLLTDKFKTQKQNLAQLKKQAILKSLQKQLEGLRKQRNETEKELAAAEKKLHKQEREIARKYNQKSIDALENGYFTSPDGKKQYLENARVLIGLCSKTSNDADSDAEKGVKKAQELIKNATPDEIKKTADAMTHPTFAGCNDPAELEMVYMLLTDEQLKTLYQKQSNYKNVIRKHARVLRGNIDLTARLLTVCNDDPGLKAQLLKVKPEGRHAAAVLAQGNLSQHLGQLVTAGAYGRLVELVRTILTMRPNSGRKSLNGSLRKNMDAKRVKLFEYLNNNTTSVEVLASVLRGLENNDALLKLVVENLSNDRVKAAGKYLRSGEFKSKNARVENLDKKSDSLLQEMQGLRSVINSIEGSNSGNTEEIKNLGIDLGDKQGEYSKIDEEREEAAQERGDAVERINTNKELAQKIEEIKGLDEPADEEDNNGGGFGMSGGDS